MLAVMITFLRPPNRMTDVKFAYRAA